MLPSTKELPEVKSFIGVIFAVAGNILISVALNIQKNAHNELRKHHQLDQLDYEAYVGDYSRNSESNAHNLDNNDIEGYEVLLDPEQYSETHYLHSKAWWAGILLMIVGELGNFIAYAFAPASVVAPLGTVALISNVILAPIMLKETFRTQDLLGILIAIIGAVLVVLTSKSEEVKLSPEAIWAAINQIQFIAYLSITCALAILLIYLSNNIGHKLIIIDLSLVAIFGGYTVLSTKAISSLLTMKFVMMFKYPITYILLFILMSTAVLQVKFLNRALKQFDSTEVIPTQFVLFTISAITGSAVLYNDFAEMDFWKCSSFLSGCFMTFLGVYFITSNRSKSQGYIPISHQGPNSPRNSIIVDPFRPPISDTIAFNSSERRFSQRSLATSIPRRHTHRGLINSSTPTLNGGYGSFSNSSSRNDNLLQSLVHGVTTNSLTAGVSQALNSVGARHSHALGLDRVFENYWLKMMEEQRGIHRSSSVPILSSRARDFENYNGNGTNDNQDYDSENPEANLNDSSYLSTSYTNSSHYDSEYTDSAHTDNGEDDDDDDSRTVSGFTISTNDSNARLYMDTNSTHDEFSGISYHSEDMDDLPDLPLRRDYGGGVTESESEM